MTAPHRKMLYTFAWLSGVTRGLDGAAWRFDLSGVRRDGAGQTERQVYVPG